ncbi:MAG: DUF255 domain-containing protein [Candidatus Latescibacterota bacterium]
MSARATRRMRTRLGRRSAALLGGLVAVAALAVGAHRLFGGPEPGGGFASDVAAAHADEVHPHAAKLRHPDGSWKYTNALAGETSPYLLLHAHNPVDWYPWGPEALSRARAEDKPIFLSVGYSTCYWCHVMERQVFSDPQISALMNQWFVNIKVDREERPDLDEIYMTATQLLTGSGGWPNSLFLTPELTPFYAGTYFPPQSRFGLPGFPEVLQAVRQAWVERRGEVEQHAGQLAEAIRQNQEARGAAGDSAALRQQLVDAAVDRLKARFDAVHGGFGEAPKFPPDMDLELLMAQYERTGEEELLHLVTHTLEQMARGGIHDHLGGGFHRYSTDPRWQVPHFEKMLYNQAALAQVYLHAYELTSREEFRSTARDVLAFTSRELRSPEGGFYSALDAETDGVEGLYYLWTEHEIRQVLGDQADLFLAVFGLAPMPDGDKGVLYMPRSPAHAARERGLTAATLEEQLAPLRQRLLGVRQQRPRPLLDTKVLAGWNGLMIHAYAYGYQILGDRACLEAAQQAAALVLQRLRDEEGRLQRSLRAGPARHDAFQEDYAFLARGLLGLHRATGNQGYLRQAQELAATMQRLFWDEEDGGFFLTDRSEHLIARTKSPYDGAVPSGNSEAANVLVGLAAATGQDAYREMARGTMQAFAGAMGESSGAFPRMLLALHRYLNADHGGIARELPRPAGAAAATMAAAPTTEGFLPGPGKRIDGRDSVPRDSAAYVRAEPVLSADRLIPGRAFTIAVRLEVAPGWHINANPASYDFLIPTTVQLASDPLASDLPVEVVSVDYPPAGVFRPAFADDSLSVYSGRVVVQVTLRLGAAAPPGASGRLALRLGYQACDETQCLAPAEVIVPVEVAVAGPAERPARLHP